LKTNLCLFAALEVKEAYIFANGTSITLSMDLSAIPCNNITTTTLVAKLQFFNVTEENCKKVMENGNVGYVYKQKIIKLRGLPDATSKKNVTFHQVVKGCYTIHLFPSTNGTAGQTYYTYKTIFSRSNLSKEDLKHGHLTRVAEKSGRSVRCVLFFI
jgi:hypothetical protein